jgi:CRP-like cAMP-binding protein
MLGLYELVGHLSNILFSIGFAIKDTLWLRVFMVVGSAVEIVYAFGITDHPLWVNVFWASLGVALNGVQIGMILRERSPSAFTAEEIDLFRTVFGGLGHTDFRRLLRIARRTNAQPGTVLVTEGQEVAELILVLEGKGVVTVHDTPVATISARQFIGEMAFLRGGVASATVTSHQATRCLVWSREELKKLMQQHPSLETGMQSILGVDLATKLATTSQHAVNRLASVRPRGDVALATKEHRLR